jgi:hypothetical protein
VRIELACEMNTYDVKEFSSGRHIHLVKYILLDEMEKHMHLTAQYNLCQREECHVHCLTMRIELVLKEY